MIRPNTCIEDLKGDDGEWVSYCGCGSSWPLGQMVGVCTECVSARCEHAKWGVQIEQMRIIP